jgi:hypothetical protein
MAEALATVPGALSRLLRLPRAERGAALWHVTPLIDVVAYHFSWLWVLLPLLLGGGQQPGDYVLLYAAIMTVTFAHRHFSLPYVYLDRQVFVQRRLRFIVAPVLMVAALLASPPLWRTPGGRAAIGAVAFAAALWNLWHVYMQKYGILRLYNAKARGAGPGVPGWVDRWLILGWMPLYFVYLGPAHRDLLVEHARAVDAYLLPLVDTLARLRPLLLLPSIACVAASLLVFLRHERRTFGLRHPARLSMAAAMTLLAASFLVCNPLKVYLAYAFSHAVEYMVFVWAFQRRRYAGATTQVTAMARLLRRPWLFYAVLLAVTGGGYVWLRYYGQYVFAHHPPIVLAGTPAARWIFFWGIYQSLMHFDYDGVLWRMRQPQVRGSI